MKTFLTLLLAMVVIRVQGAQIKYYDDYPNNPDPPTNYIISLQTTDKTPGGTPYNFWTLGQMVAWLQLRGFTNGGGTSINIITNVNLLYATNIYATNITVQNITNNNFITTNLTIEFPGGETNLNLTPNSVVQTDPNDAYISVPNASGVMTNDGAGAIGFSQYLSLTEVDAANFFPTNFFTGLTNYSVLGTDGNGLLTLGSSTLTNISITNLYAETITNNTFVNTNTVIISGKATVNTLIVTNVSFVNGPTNQAATASTVAYNKSDKTLGSVANGYGILTNDGAGAVAFTSTYPQGDGSGITNLTYRYTTNNSGTTTLSWGVAYRTNIAANVTIALASPGAAFYESTVYWVTNSSASDRTVTGPSGCIGPVGTGTPSVMTATNKTLTRFLFEHYGPSDITVSKTDFGN